MFNIYKVYKLAAVYKCLEIVKGSGKLNFVMQSQFVSLFINCKAALPIRDCQSITLAAAAEAQLWLFCIKWGSSSGSVSGAWCQCIH